MLMMRVGRILQNLNAGRTVEEAEVRQHAEDCAVLMERAYARFEATGIASDREEAVLWMHTRDQALRSLVFPQGRG
jgi:outer membrane lipopolysaccharide assembly protein LptE/RlpB